MDIVASGFDLKTNMEDLFKQYIQTLEQQGLIKMVKPNEQAPMFGDYMIMFYDTYKSGHQSVTVVNRNRIIRNHILPEFGQKKIDCIRTSDLQQYFNRLGKKYARETAMKIKNIMSPVFDAAVEDELILRNPFKSKRLELSGKDSVPHKAIPADKFQNVKDGLAELPWRERMIGGLLCYTGMRFEEVLGVKWEDIEDEWISVNRAVIHPERNKPEVKCPKTKTSKRRIPLHQELKKLIDSFDGSDKVGFLIFTGNDPKHEAPLSYTEARNSLWKIRKRFDIKEYSAHDFRDTCATVWRENGIPLDVIARLLGHSKTETTEKRYVKYRTEIMENARKLM